MEFDMTVEIPAGNRNKYEIDHDTDCLFVDRFMTVAMYYPTNYGYIPQTLAGDGDPVDVLVITPFPLIPGVVVLCRAIGVLKMTDDGGVDAKGHTKDELLEKAKDRDISGRSSMTCVAAA